MDVTSLGDEARGTNAGPSYSNAGYIAGTTGNAHPSILPSFGDVQSKGNAINAPYEKPGKSASALNYYYNNGPIPNDNQQNIYTTNGIPPGGNTVLSDTTAIEMMSMNRDSDTTLEALSRPPSYSEVYKPLEPLPEPTGCTPCTPCLMCGKFLAKSRGNAGGTLKSISGWIGKGVLLILMLGYTCYFIAALVHSVEKARALIILTSLCTASIVYVYIRNHWGKAIYGVLFRPVENLLQKHWRWLQWIVGLLVLVGFVVFLAVDVVKSWMQLASLGGMLGFLLLLFVTSKHPNHLRFRPIVWGMGLQFVFGVIVLRWRPGYDAIDWVAKQVQTFLEYTNEASEVVFGEYLDHPFIFMIMPMLIFFATVIAILHFLGIIQTIVGKMGWFMSVTMGTTAVESISVAANIFLSGLDSIMLVRPYLMSLTKSEFFTIMVGNHATLAGFAFAAFIALGAPGRHLLSAAVMSAPAVMAVCKLNYPETEVSVLKTEADVKMGKASERNIIEAASNAASLAGKTIAAVVVNLTAFIAILAFLNTTILWLGERVGYSDWSFQKACSYLLLPLVYLMGVEHKDAQKVAELLGWKIFASEIIAFAELGNMIDNNLLTERTQVITTYALCGFSSLSTVALSIGVWSAVEPRRMHEVTGQVLRVVFNANISCFLTACVAGLLVHVPDNGLGNNNGNLTTTMIPTTTDPDGWLWEIIDEIIDCIFEPDLPQCQDARMAKLTRRMTSRGALRLG